jgi:HEAT repeat protein
MFKEMLTSIRITRNVRILKRGLRSDRCSAAQTLGTVGDARAIVPLLEALTDEHGPVRQAAAEALARLAETLGKRPGPHAIEPLLEALEIKDEHVRQAAARALGQLGDSRAVEPLIRAIRLRYGDSRVAVAESLGKLGDVRAVPSLIESLGYDRGNERRAAAEALARLGEPKWQELVRGDSEDYARLAGSDDRRAVETVVRALWGDDSKLAAKALITLGPRAVTPLIRVLDQSYNYRAAEVLGILGDKRAVEPLIKTLADRKAGGRAVAAEALGKLRDARAITPLIEILRDEAWSVRKAAATVLGTFGDDRAVEPLIKLLRDDNKEVRKASVESLGQLGDARAVEPLVELAGDFHVGEVAAEALGKLRDSRAVDALIQALAKSGFGDCSAVARALGQLGDGRAIEALIGALGSGRSSVRKAAADSLAQLGEPKWREVVRGDAQDFTRLGQSGDNRAVNPLIRALQNDRESQKAAIEAMTLLGQCAVTPLIRSLGGKRERGESWDGRAAAVRTLGLLGDLQAVEQLICALSEDDSGVRCAAAEALGRLGDSRAVRPLIKALASKHGFRTVGTIAAESLGKLGDRQAVEALLQAISDDECCYHDTAAKSLGNLGDPRAVEPLIDLLTRVGKHGKTGALPARRAAVQALLRLAAVTPESILPHWERISTLAREPEHHSHKDYSPPSDCHQDSHTDSGIGLELPDPPATLTKDTTSATEPSTEQVIVLPCPNPACGKQLKVPIHLAGRTGRCPACRAEVHIPSTPDTGGQVKRDF